MNRYYAAQIVAAMERHLRNSPEKTSRARIKRLRGKQNATFRLRVRDYRLFYDVGERVVHVVAILHKSQTRAFYQEERS